MSQLLVRNNVKKLKRKCAAFGCFSFNDGKHSLFTFPNCFSVRDGKSVIDEANLQRCRTWVRMCRNSTLSTIDERELHNRYFICSEHFDSKYFTSDKRNRLRNNAVPFDLAVSSSGDFNDPNCSGPTNAQEIHPITESCVTACSSTARNEPSNYEEASVLSIGDLKDRNCAGPSNVQEIHPITESCVSAGSSTARNESSNYEEVSVLSTGDLKDRNCAGQSNVQGILNPITEPCIDRVSNIARDESNNNEDPVLPTKAQNSHRKIPTHRRKCSAISCGISKEIGTNVCLFTFPKCKPISEPNPAVPDENLERCLKWVQLSGNTQLLNISVHKLHNHHFLCSNHFEENQFSNSRKNRLRKDAVPSLFEHVGLISDEQITEYNSDQQTNVPSSNDAGFTNDVHPFEKKMKCLMWKECANCNEIFMTFPEEFQHCIHRSKCSNFSEENLMDPGSVPSELQGLTFIEEKLIARVHPVITVFKLKGLQYGYGGNVINFMQDTTSFAKTLPCQIEELSAIISVQFNNHHNDNVNIFRVRTEKIRVALQWLKENNAFYRDIEISSDNLRSLPNDENVFNRLRTMNSSLDFTDGEREAEVDENDFYGSLQESFLPKVTASNVDTQVRDNIYRWPTLSSDPLNEFTTPGYIPCAFPTLFPTGKADLTASRNIKINTSQYFRHLINYKDRRFAQHPTFRFFCLNTWMRWTAITSGSLFIKKEQDLNNMTVPKLKDLMTKQPNIVKKIMFRGLNLRGTKAYWKTRTQDLIAMVEQLGLPTIFLTLSCADLHWPDLQRLISMETDLSSLTEQERRIHLQKNPLIVDSFFSRRVDVFIKTVLESTFKITDFWYRIEYQARGSPHVHGIFWIDGAPDVSNLKNASEDELRKIAAYFENLVQCVNPDPNCEKPDTHPCRKLLAEETDLDTDLSQLLLCVQKHSKCSTDYCLRKNKKTGNIECRFKFPFDMNDTSTITFDESKRPQFIPSRNDQYLNKFNKLILQLWRANMDIAPVLSKDALIQYLSKYISKCEVSSKTFGELMNSVLKETDDTDTVKKVIQKALIRTCAERDYSAQEVCHILSGEKLYSAGRRNFVYVNLSPSKEWVEVPPDNDTTCQVPGTKGNVEKYIARPENMDSVTLWTSLSSYNMQKWTEKKVKNIVRIFPRLHLGSDENINEQFYRQQVLLHIPWRSEQDFKHDLVSWKDIFMEKVVCTPLNLLSCDEVNEQDEYENSDHEDEELMLEDWMIISQHGPNKDTPQIELGLREVDLEYNWLNDVDKYKAYGNTSDLQNFIQINKEKNTAGTSLENVPDVVFSEDQSAVIALMNEQISSLKNQSKDTTIPRRVIIQGKAGCGKSLLIKYLTNTLRREFNGESYLLLAPTGVAAININGQTIHSTLKIPLQRKSFQELTGEAARSFCDSLENVHFLIIDEYSMIGCNMLGMIDNRCRQGKGNSEPFGNLFIYLLGDIRQLPPVKDAAFYSNTVNTEFAAQGKSLLNTFEKVFILHQCFRQKDNIFQSLLDRLSIGQSTVSDYELLSSRFTTVLSSSQRQCFHNAIRLYATKKEVSDFNFQALASLKDENNMPVPIARITAKHNCAAAAKASSEEADGLYRVLYLAKNCKIMLKSNLWTQKGLVNGAIGTVVDIIYNPDMSQGLPEVIMCEFPRYTGPGIGPNGNIVPIPPVSRSWKTENGENCTRVNFPTVPCYACSIHKSQGLTLDKAVIDIGKSEFAVGLSYVALSRIKTLNGLLIAPFIFDRIANLKLLATMKNRQKFEEFLERLQ